MKCEIFQIIVRELVRAIISLVAVVRGDSVKYTVEVISEHIAPHIKKIMEIRLGAVFR